MDIVLDSSTRTVTGTIRWDMAWIVSDQIYDPASPDYVPGGPSYSGWEMDTTETGWMDAVACGYVLYGPRQLDIYPMELSDWDAPPRPGS